jgi:hypothetical protein
MKRYKTWLGILLTIIGVSCTDILDRDPIATLDAGSYFQSEADLVQALNAAYRPLLFNNRNNNFYWAFSVLTSDEAITGGDGSRPGLVEMDAFTYTPRTEELNSFWKLQYEGITQANLVLDHVDEVALSDAARNAISGQALFLRSFYYFQLVQVFGDVPLMLQILPPDALKLPRTSRDQVWNQIIADCQKAAAILPVKWGAADAGRATQGAAYALAAKTALYARKYDDCLAFIQKVKATGAYSLMSDYEASFRKETENNSESVFEVQHANLQLGVGNFLNQWWLSRKLLGYGFAEVREEYVNAFEAGDPRRKATIAARDEPYFGSVYKNSFSTTRYSPRKYLQDTASVTQPADGDINYVAIRYADVLLWEAEALNELGRSAEALVPLEAVRARARAQSTTPATALPPVTVTSQSDLRAAIQRERRVELGFEMHRFFDLVRWGIAGDVLPGFVKGKHEVFPIPQTEIDLNPKLTQNAGY